MDDICPRQTGNSKRSGPWLNWNISRRSRSERLTFRGLEKNATTVRLARMNLAVHGLEGDIQRAITYYEDPHALVGEADYVMANPPFNVDEIDAEKIKADPRLPFGLPGVNKKGKVSNGNYVWISYFYSYLNERGKAGFVMSSQASSAGRDEARLRQALVETGDVDAMIGIRGNFFYTRSVPCELWFLNRAKPIEHRDKVLMIDARQIYRKVTRKIYDFSPEQQLNLQAIVWLYRGESQRYLALVEEYGRRTLAEAGACFERVDEEGEADAPLADFDSALDALAESATPFLDSLNDASPSLAPLKEAREELAQARRAFSVDVASFRDELYAQKREWQKVVENQASANGAFKQAIDNLAPLAEASRDLVKQTDLLYKLACRVLDDCEQEYAAKKSSLWPSREINRACKTADAGRHEVVEQLKAVRYFWKQAHWLTERFPEAKLREVEGLVKLVSIEEIAANDWSLTPGRYVGVAPEEEDEDFDFEETLREIHVELADLDAEATKLAAKIRRNFEELGV